MKTYKVITMKVLLSFLNFFAGMIQSKERWRRKSVLSLTDVPKQTASARLKQ